MITGNTVFILPIICAWLTWKIKVYKYDVVMKFSTMVKIIKVSWAAAPGPYMYSYKRVHISLQAGWNAVEHIYLELWIPTIPFIPLFSKHFLSLSLSLSLFARIHSLYFCAENVKDFVKEEKRRFLQLFKKNNWCPQPSSCTSICISQSK